MILAAGRAILFSEDPGAAAQTLRDEINSAREKLSREIATFVASE
jgi:hypothetical protein